MKTTSGCWSPATSTENPEDYAAKAGEFLREARGREPANGLVRLGLLGVPPIMSDLHQRLDEIGGQIVFNEVPRQFAMLPDGGSPPKSLVEQYRNYTYPYNVFFRLEDLKREIKRRELKGLVHYTQSFCYPADAGHHLAGKTAHAHSYPGGRPHRALGFQDQNAAGGFH